MGYSKWREFCGAGCMVRLEWYIQHEGWIGEVQRRKEHESAVGRAKEETGKGLGEGARSDLEGCLVTKDGHTIILCQGWEVDIRVGVISRCKLDKLIDKVKDE